MFLPAEDAALLWQGCAQGEVEVRHSLLQVDRHGRLRPGEPAQRGGGPLHQLQRGAQRRRGQRSGQTAILALVNITNSIPQEHQVDYVSLGSN